jgi:hypothetical protein
MAIYRTWNLNQFIDDLLEHPFGTFPRLAFDSLSIISSFVYLASGFTSLGVAYFLKLISNALGAVDTSVELDLNFDVSAISNTPIAPHLRLTILSPPLGISRQLLPRQSPDRVSVLPRAYCR